MLSTVEMRWFFGNCPLDLEAHRGESTEIQTRSDWYHMPCNAGCGIKVREGRLEMKLRHASYGDRILGPASGCLEGWKKWSLTMDDTSGPSTLELTEVDWLEVHKVRYLQRFEVESTEVSPSATRPINGCEFEITQLQVRDQQYWTVGFEAVGTSPSEIEMNLRQVALHVLARGGIREDFLATCSFGYAQWLSRFNR